MSSSAGRFWSATLALVLLFTSARCPGNASDDLHYLAARCGSLQGAIALVPDIKYITLDNMGFFGAYSPTARGPKTLKIYLHDLRAFAESTDPELQGNVRNQGGWRYVSRFSPKTGEFLIVMQKSEGGGRFGPARPLMYLKIRPEQLGFKSREEFADWALDKGNRFLRFGYSVRNLAGFANEAMREEHFQEHARQFGLGTPRAYELAAVDFIRRASPGTLAIVRGRFTYFYRPFTGELAVTEYDGRKKISFVKSYYRVKVGWHDESGAERFLNLHRRINVDADDPAQEDASPE